MVHPPPAAVFAAPRLAVRNAVGMILFSCALCAVSAPCEPTFLLFFVFRFFFFIELQKWLRGRTEAIRSSTAESVNFVSQVDKLIASGNMATARKLLDAGAGQHRAVASAASQGKGVDRHLFSLSSLAAELGHDSGELFTHPVRAPTLAHGGCLWGGGGVLLLELLRHSHIHTQVLHPRGGLFALACRVIPGALCYPSIH